jgi:hypothetical protein
MGNNDIPLHEAPERFFDSALWNEYISLHGNRELALSELGHPEPGIIGYYRDEVERQPWLHTPSTQRSRRLEKLRQDLVGRFRTQLIKGDIVATGLSPLTIDRTKIPGERWEDLCPDFVNDKAKGGTLEFTRVRLSEPTDHPTQAAALLDRCIQWLEQRKHEGEGRRKVLQGEALTVLGQDLTTRMFDTAYRAVFSRSRGRPRNNPTQPK